MYKYYILFFLIYHLPQPPHTHTHTHTHPKGSSIKGGTFQLHPTLKTVPSASEALNFKKPVK